MHTEEDDKWPAYHEYGGPRARTVVGQLVGMSIKSGAFQGEKHPEASVANEEVHDDVS